MKKWISVVLLLITCFGWAISAQSAEEISYTSAKQLLDKGKWPEAAATFRAVLEKEPRSLQALVGLTSALTHMGNREEALNILQLKLKAEKGNVRQNLVGRVRVVSCLFLTNKAVQIYQDGLNLMMARKYRAARERFEKALVEEPDNAEVLTRLGQSLVLDEDPKRALPNFKVAFRLNPFQPEIRLWLGRAFFLLNNNKEAIGELTAAQKELRGSEIAPVWLAEALAKDGQNNGAIRLLESDVKQWPSHFLSVLSLGRLRLQSTHPDTQTWISARRDLQIAMNRLDQYTARDSKGLSKTGSIGASGGIADSESSENPGESIKERESTGLSKAQFSGNWFSGRFETDLGRPSNEIRAEIQKLVQLFDNRLSQVGNQR